VQFVLPVDGFLVNLTLGDEQAGDVISPSLRKFSQIDRVLTIAGDTFDLHCVGECIFFASKI
jgi:hypothetical protein